MKTTSFPITHTLRCLAALLLTCAATRAGQSAALALGGQARNKSFDYPSGVAVGALTHKVFVCDEARHRVLRFSSAESLQNGGAAEAVLGQAGFTTETAAGSASGMKQPEGLAVDGTLRLWVADTASHRVLLFNSPATKADGAAAGKRCYHLQAP